MFIPNYAKWNNPTVDKINEDFIIVISRIVFSADIEYTIKRLKPVFLARGAEGTG